MTSLPLPEWFLRWLSVDVDSLEGGSAALRFARFPEGDLGLLAILGFAAIIAFIVWIYLREGSLATWRKLGLASIRAALVVALAIVVFYPILEVHRARDLRATTIVLLDDSLSVGIPDRYLGAPEMKSKIAELLSVEAPKVDSYTRAAIASHVLAPERGFLAALAKENRLAVYTFSDELRTVSGDSAAGETPPPDGGATTTTPPTVSPPKTAPTAEEPAIVVPTVELTPRGPRTDLASALRTAIDREGGGRVAAVVIVSDGRLTAGEGTSGVSELLRQKGIPVHTIGIGDPTPPRNWRITAVLASERVFAGDPINVEVRVRQMGYEGETVEVSLEDILDGGEGLQIEPQSITFEEGVEESSAYFRLELSQLGKHRLVASVPTLDEEAFADDNELPANIEVVEEASKVLLIAGAPTWEYRFLKNLLRRDRRAFLAAWLQSADPDYPQEGDTSLERLPLDPKDLYEYDVVLLLDPDPSGLPPEFPGLLRDFVGKHRGGLLYVAGEKFGAEFFRARATETLLEMLPIVPDPSRLEAGAGFSDRSYPLLPTRAASAHAATKLSSRPDRNLARWQELSGVYWSFPVAREKPGATVLLRYGDPRFATGNEGMPSLAWQFYEGGRTMFLGIDETWRWRSTTAEIYDQFWVQTVRYLTETRLLGSRRQLLQTDSESADLGDIVRVSAMVLDESYAPLSVASQTATIVDPEGETSELVLEADATAPGWYRGIFIPRRLGEHQLSLSAEAQTSVRIEPPDLEFQEPRLDEATLRELANRTSGSYSPVWEAASVPDRIPDRRQTVISTDEPIPLWDNTFVMYLLAGLLTLEWLLRKWNRLL